MGVGVGWGGSFHASPNQGSLICWPTRGITKNTTSRSGRSRPPAAASGILGVRTFGRSTPRGCLPQCLPKGGVFGLDGLTPAARARSRSLPPLPVSRLVSSFKGIGWQTLELGKFGNFACNFVHPSNVIVGQKGSPKTSFLLFTPDSFTSPTRIHSSPILPF